MCEFCGVADHVADDGGPGGVGDPGGIGVFAVAPGSVGRPPTAVSGDSGNDFVDAIINNGRHYVNPTGVTGPVQINYIFTTLTDPVDPVTGVNVPYTWRPFEMAAWSKAVQGWEHVANVDFVQVFDIADALFLERLENQATAGGTVSASHSLPSSTLTNQSRGTYNFEAVNVRQWSPDQLEAGGNFYRTFIHETGHGLGLKHPHDSGGAFDPDFFPGIDATDSSAVRQRSLGVLELNHMFGSVMSYLHGYEFDEQGRVDVVATRQRPVADDFFLDHGFAATPMAYDVAAVQYLYGANMSFRTGNNVYILPDSNSPHPFVRGAPNEVGEQETIIYQPDTAYWECIWDAGGIDEIRYDVMDAEGNAVAGTRNVIIDLTAATLDYSETGYGVLSYAAFIGGGYTIANGVVIENATGGDGNDELTGNSAANLLTGRGGDDLFNAKAGSDFVDGGAGRDTAKFSGAKVDYAISRLTNGDVQVTDLRANSPDGIDTLRGVEHLAFSDIAFNMNESAARTDFDGDGKSGLLWQNTDGTVAIWSMDGLKLTSGANVGSNPGAAWDVIGSGDFNGDGKADILWQNTNGQTAVWLMDGTKVLSGADVGGNQIPAWHEIVAGDFNGDGKSDILWQHDTGQVAMWQMDGLEVTAGSNVGVSPGAAWHVIGAGDFDGDGKSDILWQNNDGQAAVWLMDGFTVKSGANVGANPGSDWHVQGAGDFDGDGKADILWQNKDGTPAIWLMDGLDVVQGANVGFNPGPAWQIHGTGDFDGDGRSDIQWQNTDGTPAVWLMNGFDVVAGADVGFNPGTNWHEVPGHHSLV
jgi:hypothetical protein